MKRQVTAGGGSSLSSHIFIEEAQAPRVKRSKVQTKKLKREQADERGGTCKEELEMRDLPREGIWGGASPAAVPLRCFSRTDERTTCSRSLHAAVTSRPSAICHVPERVW